MTNRYTRALKQIKSKSIDEKLELLSEVPTNNSGGLYVDVPGVYTTPPITNPIGVTGTPVDLNQDGDGSEGYDGQDTTGLFKEDGTVLTVIPPGDNSYILGPMISMWYAWANYTQIGYVRQSDRKMVNLGRIVGELDDWDGSSGFTSYGQMSVEQAAWYQAQSRQDYRAFYPGPPSNPADSHGRYLGSIVSESRFPNTSTQPKVAHTPGTQTGPDPSDDFASLLKKKELEDKKKFDEKMQMLANAVMLGLDVVAVLALLFPEPASSAAGAAHLASKLRYASKLYRALRKYNPFKGPGKWWNKGRDTRVPNENRASWRDLMRDDLAQRGQSDAAFKAGKPPRGIGRPDQAFNPFRPASKGGPGSGPTPAVRQAFERPVRAVRDNPTAGTLVRSTVRGASDSESSKTKSKKRIREELLEAAPTGSGPAGGTEIADMYVDEVSKTSSPEDLENASNEANNIAREGNQGLSDSELAKIDKDADREARRQTRINMSRPESMSSDQLSNSITLMYEADAGLFEELAAKYDNLIDQKSLDAAYAEYNERNEYINSWENYYALSPKFERYYKDAERLHNTYVSKLYFGRDANGNPKITFGGERIWGTIYQEKLDEWADLFTKTWDTFNSDVIPKTYKQRDANREKLSKASDAAFRQHLIAIIKEWNASDDPFSIKDYINQLGGLQNMSEADKKKLREYLAKMGLSYGNIASVDAMNLGIDATIAIGSLGIAGLMALYNISNDAATNLINAITKASPGTGDSADYDNPYTRDKRQKNTERMGELQRQGDAREAGQSEAEKQEIADADQQLQDAEAEIKDAEASGNQDRIDRAHDNYTKARNNRTRVGNKWKENRKNQKMESYEPKFLKQRTSQTIKEVITSKQKRILREIKKPFEIKEAPTKFKVKPTGRKNKSVGVDMMKIPEIPNQFKPPAPSIWSAKDREKNIRASQERKNEVLELVGAAEHHWTYLTEKKRKEDQEKVNEMMSAEFDKHLELMYENHRIKEERMNKAIKAVKKSSDLAPEYPENPPPQLDPETDMHPKYGKHYKHDKLDPHSAEAMPPTGNPEIDANIKKATNAKEKARKLKTLMGKTKRG